MKNKKVSLKDLKLKEETRYPIIKYDSNGNKTYYEDSDGYWYKREYDSNGNMTYFETSSGYWERYEYDSNDNETYYEDSSGYWYKCEYDSNDNETYYENSKGNWEKYEEGHKIEFKKGKYYIDGKEAVLKRK